MKERDVMAYMEKVSSLGIVPGLESIRELCARLGDPQKNLKFVHIAGTNGKGSVSAYIASALRQGGYGVGRYISPVIFEYRERIQVNDHMITKEALCRIMERIINVCKEMTAEGLPHPTPFEMETALGFLYFQEKNCDIVVLETGMGGLLDATNVVENTCVAVITSVSMDHMKFLGHTLAEIGEHKAGILKKDCLAVTIKQKPEVMEAIYKKAQEAGCSLTVADAEQAVHVHYGLERQQFDYKDIKKLEIGLAGQYQVDNGVLALEALRLLEKKGFGVEEKKLRKGFARTIWPGRFTVVGKKPYFIVDGAHNEDGAKRLAESLEFYFTNRKIIYIMGVLRDKEYEKIISLTHSLAEQIITVAAPGNSRALPAYELAREIALVHPDVTAADSPEEAVEMSYLLAKPEDVILAFGSLSFLGQIIKIAEKRNEGMGHRGKGSAVK